MKKKEVLIIFVLAALATGGGWVWEEIIRREANSHGFPFKFYWFVMSGGVRGVAPIRLHYTSFMPQWSYTNFLLDLLFWFLVIFVIWQMVKWVRKKYENL